MGFCLGGVAVALLMVDYGTSGQGSALLGKALETARAEHALIDRTRKGDRISTAGHQGVRERKISTVEVVGLEQAAVIYRDRDGRVLFHTDPVGNATVVVRGVMLPELTVRESNRTAVQPVIVNTPQPVTTEPPRINMPEPAARNKPKLPDGCEPMVSPLSGSGVTGIPGRCVAVIEGPRRLASR